MPLTQGTRLGYEIVASLGAGVMREVYRAKELRLGREVALKVLPADVASHPDRLARSEGEARTVAGLSHPNIVVPHSVEDDGEAPPCPRFLVASDGTSGATRPPVPPRESNPRPLEAGGARSQFGAPRRNRRRPCNPSISCATT